MNPDLRRNACPTIAAPMETGDGLLARLPPLGARDAAAFRAVADAASRFGNGIVEITARGSIQVRGLSPATTPGFAATLAAAGIGDARPAVHVPPLAVDPVIASLAAALRAAIEAAGLGPRLAPKTAVIVDGAGPLPLDGLDGDLRLVLGADEVTLAIGGSATTARVLGRVPVDGALDAAVAVLAAMARLGPAARGRDLDAPAMAAAIGAAPAETAEA
ncbi:MAG: precorrin-3B synthase, partial [Rhizobiales bacterium]|nr:precorrin-3B synthase [Hyphomicrobiales bacterium]